MRNELSKRLQAVADLVTVRECVADIGTDHAYIPIYLTEHKKVKKAFAMDVNEGPLIRAEEHVREAGLKEQIKMRRSNGLEKLSPGEVEAVIIAGMGGGLVMRILTEGQAVAETLQECILQPQSEIALVREFLRVRNFQILNEDMILEDGKYYPMMKVSQQKAAEQTKILPQEVADAFGPVLLQKRHPVLKEWLERELRTTNSVIEQLSAQPDHERIRNRMQQVNCKKTLILEALKNYGTESVQSDD